MIHRGSTDLGFDSGSLLHWDRHQTVFCCFLSCCLFLCGLADP